MHKIPPTERCKQLAAAVNYPYEGFVPDEQAAFSWTFSGDIRTPEAKQLIRYYIDHIRPSINERAKERGLRISEKMAIKPTVHWLRGAFIENNHDAAVFIFLLVPTPTPSQSPPSVTFPSQIDWAEDPYIEKRAAVGMNRNTKPEPIDIESGLALQLDPQEILFPNPSMQGICTLMFGHNYEEVTQ